MSRTIVRTDKAPTPPAPFSQAVKAGGLVFVSGIGPYDATTGAVVGATIQDQTAQCLRNISAILEAAGSSLAQAVSATVILTDPEDFPGLNEEWAKWFPTDPPARQGAKMPINVPGMKLSVAIIAAAQ